MSGILQTLLKYNREPFLKIVVWASDISYDLTTCSAKTIKYELDSF